MTALSYLIKVDINPSFKIETAFLQYYIASKVGIL